MIVVIFKCQISKNKIQQYKAEENIRREIELQNKLDNKYVLKIIETLEDNNNLFIILEYCNSGSIFDVLSSKKKLTEKEAFPYFYQICRGIDYLHKNDIAHRDIKVFIFFNDLMQPDNILIHNQYIKICDFNWAIELKKNQKADGVICGTTEYMPPEVVMKQQHDKSVDIWSLGIVLYVSN